MQDEGRQAVKGLLLARPRELLGEPRVQNDHGGLLGQGRHQLLVLLGKPRPRGRANRKQPKDLPLDLQGDGTPPWPAGEGDRRWPGQTRSRRPWPRPLLIHALQHPLGPHR